MWIVIKKGTINRFLFFVLLIVIDFLIQKFTIEKGSSLNQLIELCLNEDKFFTLDMSKRFFETAVHSDFYAQCRPTYPADIITRICDYLSLKV